MHIVHSLLCTVFCQLFRFSWTERGNLFKQPGSSGFCKYVRYLERFLGQFLSQQFVGSSKNKEDLRHDCHYRERTGGIFSTIIFLKSIGSTDQNAL